MDKLWYSQTMKYYSAIGWISSAFDQSKKPNPNDYKSYDSIYMSFSERQKEEAGDQISGGQGWDEKMC